MTEKNDYKKLFPTAADDIEHAKDSQLSEQSSSPAYKLAYDDLDFVLRDEMRSVRLLLELSKPELILQDHNIEHTVVMFGSARITEHDATQQLCDDLERKLKQLPDEKTLQDQLKLARARQRYCQYYDQARALAGLITKQSGQGSTPQLHIVTGGGPGIMEAANRGACEAGGKSIGLNIVLPHEQHPNAYITPELCFRFHYFAMRKLHFLLRAKALIVFPGGYGTLDELFEVLTLVQTHKTEPMPILLFGRDYWQRLINFDLLLEEGMLAEEDLKHIQYVENVQEAWEIIENDIGKIT